jgi:hypothetical protein
MKTDVRLLAEVKRRDELVEARYLVDAVKGLVEPSDELIGLVDDFDDAYQELEGKDREEYVFCDHTQAAMRWVDPILYGLMLDGPLVLSEEQAFKLVRLANEKEKVNR